jgi:hypothetical protein
MDMKPGGPGWVVVARLLLCLALPLGIAGCGGDGGSDAPAYALRIDPPASLTTTAAEAFLTGEGFLPPGSTCSGDCSGLLPPPVFGQLGPYTLVWRNEATGGTGPLNLAWICNCGGSAPYWMGRVPLAQGANRIAVTMTAGSDQQSDSVTITRE